METEATGFGLQLLDVTFGARNVGDGDSQLVLLPEDSNHNRAAIIVDSFTPKVTRLVTSLSTAAVLPGGRDIPLVVVTHLHRDHMSNIPRLFRDHGDRTIEFSTPGTSMTPEPTLVQ